MTYDERTRRFCPVLWCGNKTTRVTILYPRRRIDVTIDIFLGPDTFFLHQSSVMGLDYFTKTRHCTTTAYKRGRTPSTTLMRSHLVNSRPVPRGKGAR